jgi:hypothetical protein
MSEDTAAQDQRNLEAALRAKDRANEIVRQTRAKVRANNNAKAKGGKQ